MEKGRSDKQSHRRLVLTYPLGSGDRHFEVEEQRTVYLELNPEVGPRLIGEIAASGEKSDINLAELLLEFALFLEEVQDRDRVLRQVEFFGDQIGRSLAKMIQEDWPDLSLLEQAGRALDCVLFSMGARYTVRRVKNVLRYDLDLCPLKVVAQSKGRTLEEESSHQILMAICQSLVQAICPTIEVKIPGNSEAAHTIKVFATTGERNNSVRFNSNGELDRKSGRLNPLGGPLAFLYSETPPPLQRIMGRRAH